MKLNLLGSGGASPLPRPGCFCQKCEKARNEGIPYYRTGPSLYVYDEALLFDTAEGAARQLNRERIPKVSSIFYTHWHPDHTQGVRIIEHLVARNTTVEGIKEPRRPAIKVFLPEKDKEIFFDQVPCLSFFEKKKWAIVKTLKDREVIKVGSVKVSIFDFQRKDRARFGYLIEKDGKKVYYAPCSVYQIKVRKEFCGADLLFLEMGWPAEPEIRAKIAKDHWWHDHNSYQETIELIGQIKPKKTILTHLGGYVHLDYDWANELIAPYQEKYDLEIGYDGMRIEID